MGKKIVIQGAGPLGIDLLETLLLINSVSNEDRYECCGFLDDNPSLHGTCIYGVQVFGPLANAVTFADCFFVHAISSPHSYFRREQMIDQIHIPIERYETIIHPLANVSSYSHIGPGSIILQHATVAAKVCIGNQVIISPNCVINHDCRIGHYSTLASGVCLAGGVQAGKSCYFGMNSSVLGNVTINDNALVGMGSVVLKDVPPRHVVAGNPAKYIREV